MGYNIGDAEAAHAAAAAANTSLGSSLGGPPSQLDLSSNRKRKLPGTTSIGSPASGGAGGSGQTPYLSGIGSANEYQVSSANPYASAVGTGGAAFNASMPAGNANGGSLYTGQGNLSPVNSPYAASIGQYNAAALSQSQQQHFAQAYQNQYSGAVGQLQAQQGGSGPASTSNMGAGAGGAAAGTSGASRLHRPSRLSTSFGPTGATAASTQVLPSSTSAHLLPSQTPPSASGTGQSGIHAASSSSTLANSKRNRPLAGNGQGANSLSGAAGGGGAGHAGNRKKKKRIMISDEESGAEEGASEDAEEAEDDEIMMLEDETNTGMKGNRRGGGIATNPNTGVSTQRAGSRAGTPLSNAPTPGSATSTTLGGANNGPNGPRIRASGTRQNRQQLTSGLYNKRGGAKADHDEEDEDAEADAEGEEDWGNEADETNADDPTLYCLCHRVSYGNVSLKRGCIRVRHKSRR